jgi:hypothetical protein
MLYFRTVSDVILLLSIPQIPVQLGNPKLVGARLLVCQTNKRAGPNDVLLADPRSGHVTDGLGEVCSGWERTIEERLEDGV